MQSQAYLDNFGIIFFFLNLQAVCICDFFFLSQSSVFDCPRELYSARVLKDPYTREFFFLTPCDNWWRSVVLSFFSKSESLSGAIYYRFD